MGERHTCNSDRTLKFFIERARELYKQHKYVTFEWRIGPDRSIDQNSLLHAWAFEYGCHIGGLSKAEGKPGREQIIEGTKRGAKGEFYRETGYEWMVHTIKNPFTGEEKVDFRSSKRYSRGQMFEFLTWLQCHADINGCVLESKGEYAKLKREQNA